MKFLCVILSLFLITSTVCAESQIISTDNFTTVKQLIEQNKHPHHLLLALDDDDTLTMMPCPSPSNCQYLGSPAWFSWQYNLPLNSKDRVWHQFPQLIAITSLIFDMSQMVLTDSKIPDTLKTADNRGVVTLVETARGYSQAGSTERQFSQNHILHYIEKDAIHTSKNHISYPGFYFPEPFNKSPVRRVAYLHGIYYVDGQNKGEMIKQLLEKTKQTKNIRTIIFVDDTNQNVIDVAHVYKNNPRVNVISVHYTRLAKNKAAFLTGKNAKKLQAIANARWYAIRDFLKKTLPGFSLYHV
ncbi:MAG: hypothetical protein A3E82_00020 [Gammaproteobacteria bacterium RIFCSPHIGHO2_12_FULL_38_11]|nr:MAG: hypothetical protein A3E82_00020 [Gammaproteobacteria bacterium RIFCSPHIGHO2_12_FULL_38_11]